MFYKKRNLFGWLTRVIVLLFLLSTVNSQLSTVFAGDIEAELNSEDGSTSFDVKNSAGVTVSSITSDGDIYGNLLRLQGTGNSYFSGNVGIGTTAPGARLDVVAGSGDLLRVSTSTTGGEKMVITNAGNVGIGTTGPTGILHVDGGTASSGNGTNITIQAQNGAGDFDSGGNIFLLPGSAGLLLPGRVGIGTTGPGYLLDVSGTGVNSIISITDSDSSGDSALAQLKFFDSSGFERGMIGDSSTLNDDIYVLAASGLLRLGDSSGTSVMVLNSGNVGIGTADPSQTLQVVGQIETDGGYMDWLNLYGILNMSNNLVENIGHADTNFTSGGGLTIAGNVGIGTTSPGSRLEVDALATDKRIFGAKTAGSYKVIITTSGNVGIGTTSPTAKLDVEGLNGYDQLRMRTAYTPLGSPDPSGNVGDIAWDNDYIYVKTGSGWKRSALSSW